MFDRNHIFLESSGFVFLFLTTGNRLCAHFVFDLAMIFGYINITFNGVTYFYHPTTETDVIMNYTLGVVLVICFICSHIFNLIVFIQNYKQRLSAASMLFMILSGTIFKRITPRFAATYNIVEPTTRPPIPPLTGLVKTAVLEKRR